jgi:hypothetical protein
MKLSSLVKIISEVTETDSYVTPWSRTLLGKVMRKISGVYKSQKLVILFVIGCHWSLL